MRYFYLCHSRWSVRSFMGLRVPPNGVRGSWAQYTRVGPIRELCSVNRNEYLLPWCTAERNKRAEHTHTLSSVTGRRCTKNAQSVLARVQDTYVVAVTLQFPLGR